MEGVGVKVWEEESELEAGDKRLNGRRMEPQERPCGSDVTGLLVLALEFRGAAEGYFDGKAG